MSESFSLLNIAGGKSKDLNRENSVFKDNTIIIERDTGKFKWGDGKQPYQLLEYVGKNTLEDAILKKLNTTNKADSYALIDAAGKLPDTVIPDNILRVNTTLMMAGTAENADQFYMDYMEATKNK